MKKIIFIDIDGTLCNSKGEITEETVQAINRTQKLGNIIVLSTGRRLNRVIPLMKKCGIYSYVLALNGAQIYDYLNNTFLLEEDIGFSTSHKIYDLVRKYSLYGNFHTGLLRYTTKPTYPEDILLADDNVFELKSKKISQIVVSGNNLEAFFTIKEDLNKMEEIRIVNESRDIFYKNLDYKKGGSFIDISTVLTSKGKSIEYLLAYLHMDTKDAIAIGDGINDLSMFEVVGTKVAMGNADSFLKEQADCISLSNDENGVAYYLNNLVK